MNRIQTSARLVVASVMVVCLFIAGCGTLNRNTYRATGTVVVTADHAMNAWGAYVRSGKATAQDEAKVKLAYETYQDAAMAVTEAAIAHHETPTDTTRGRLNAAVAASGAALSNLVNLIARYVPINPTTP